MYANSVLPPLDGTLRACSSEYLAGIALNELSECQRRLPSANSRRRSSRAKTLWSLSRLDTSANVVGGRAQTGADRVLDLAQAAGERQLRLVVELLAVEDEHRVGVHARVNRRHL